MHFEKMMSDVIDHPDYKEELMGKLSGIFEVAYYQGKKNAFHMCPYSDRESIEYLAFQVGYRQGSGQTMLLNIDDLKWLDVVHVQDFFRPFVSDKCRIIRPNQESLMFIGSDEDIQSIDNVFVCHYEQSTDAPYFLSKQYTSKFNPFATATLVFEKIEV